MSKRVDDLFDLRYGHSLELNRLAEVEPPAGVNFVGRARTNNGVTARVLSDETPGEPGELTVALGGEGGVLATFVQPEAFVCGRDVMILTPKTRGMPLAERLWWARCIWENHYRYSFGRQANKTLAGIRLPSEPPAWVKDAAVPDYKSLAQPMTGYASLSDSANWGYFRIDQHFTICKGLRLTKANQLPGTNRFIGASEKNNGVTALIANIATFDAGCLTVPYNGSVGFAFYQDQPFLATDDVNVLVPKRPLNRWAQLFVATVIRHEKFRYTYGYKWTKERMEATEIRLPSTPEGEPDWAAMEAYMKSLPLSSAIATAESDILGQ